MVSKDEVQAARLIRNDFPTFCRSLVRIKNKDGDIVPFELNRAQKLLWETIKSMDARGLPIRIIILKARQLGMSTAVQAYLWWKTLTAPGSGSLVVAHQEDAAAELFGKIELMYRQMPSELYRDLEQIKDSKRQGKKLAFAGDLNSMVYVDTAGNKALGRSQTFQHVHLSEMAFYDNPEEVMFGLSQSIPKKPGTTVIVESTANGLGNYYHSRWQSASSGKSNYSPLFLPWYWDPEYSMPVDDDFAPTKAEKKLKKKYRLSNEQLQWRRMSIEDDCDGDEEKFRQENPADPDEAFIISGGTYFPTEVLEKYDAKVSKPSREGSFEITEGKPVFVDWEGGPWRIFKAPDPERFYIVGADPAGGTARDFSAAHVLDSQSLEQVASYRGKLDPDEFGRELKWIGLLYNKALIACEKNGEGRATLLKLYKDLHYPRLFYHTTEENWSGGVAQTYGWTTSSRTRPTMLAQLSELIRKGSVRVHDDRTLREMKTFVRQNKGTRVAEAAQGAWDDMVMALAIACNSEVRTQSVARIEFDPGYNEPYISETTGY